jgi:hypothetical protein
MITTGWLTRMGVVFVGLALLSQPLAKVVLGREVWNMVDVLVGVAWLATQFPERSPPFPSVRRSGPLKAR